MRDLAMKSRTLLPWIVLMLAVAPPVLAQDRSGSWEFIFDVNYQDGYDIDFDGGSSVDTDSDWGFGVGAAYHFTDRLQVQMLLDWLNADYDATIASGDTPPDPAFSVRGEYESFTPRVNVLYSFLDGDITPYVSAGIGWSFIDTNVPQGPPQTGCWWDPWWGYICTTYQNTRDTDEFAYQAGVGVRWDVTSGLTLKLGYDKEWIDLGNADSAPGFDVLRLGVAYRY
jgi:opacity protein-like surface antigen